MAAFDSINELPTQVTYAGWRFDRPPGVKITPDFPTKADAVNAIRVYARKEGLSAADKEFVVIQETTSYVPLNKMIFTITTTVTPIT